LLVVFVFGKYRGQPAGEAGEDMSFSWKVGQFLGYKIYADPQVLPGTWFVFLFHPGP